MGKLKEMGQKLGETAVAQVAERVVDPEAVEAVEALFEQLDKQEVLALIFKRGNRLGATRMELKLARGVREDLPVMPYAETVVLLVFEKKTKGGEKRFSFSIKGFISVSGRGSLGLAALPKFESEDRLERWLNQYYSGAYQVHEVLNLGDGHDWSASLCRGLGSEELAASHACRLEKIYDELSKLIEPDLEGTSENRA